MGWIFFSGYTNEIHSIYKKLPRHDFRSPTSFHMESMAEIGAETKQTYDPVRKSIKLLKRKVSDIKEHTKVFLP